MSPYIAALITGAVAVWLVARESRNATGTTSGLWVPVIWLTIIASRFPTEWVSPRGLGTLEEGSPIDQAVFGTLIVAAVVVLSRRRIAWGVLAGLNLAVWAYLGYGLVSIAWSDFPFVAFKRWIKVLGHVAMVLIVLTEPRPLDAIRSLFRRVGYLLIPASVMFIKYFPAYGRSFSSWTGEAMNTGVTTNKNSLGVLCLLVGFSLILGFVGHNQWKIARTAAGAFSAAVLVCLILWLLHLADSATSLVALFTGLITLWVLRYRWLRETHLALWIAAAAVVLLALDAQLSLSANVIESLGRDATLTDRTLLWTDVLAIPNNALLGAGFESFWLGERLAMMWEKWAFRPNQAHNGYLETYVNGGWLGLAFMGVFVWSCYRKAKVSLIQSPWLGQFRMGCLAMILVYNYTEATFKALHPLFFVMFLITLEVSREDELQTPVEESPRRLGRQLRAPIVEHGLSPFRRAVGMRKQGVNNFTVKSRARNFRHH